MNPLKSCQLSSDTSLEYQQGLVGSKWPVQPQKWPKTANFKIYSHECGVGTLNLSQESSDKMQKFNYNELRKCQKCGQILPFSLVF